MPARVAPELDDEIAETVDDEGVQLEVGRTVDVSDGTEPLRDPIELTEGVAE